MTFKGPNTYSGGTIVSGGALNLINTTGIGSGRLTMAGGNWEIPAAARWFSATSRRPGAAASPTSGRARFSTWAPGREPDRAYDRHGPEQLRHRGYLRQHHQRLLRAVHCWCGTVALTRNRLRSHHSFRRERRLAGKQRALSTGTRSTLLLVGNSTTIQPGSTLTIAAGLFTVNSPSTGITAVGNSVSATSANMLVSGGTFSQPAGNLVIGQNSPGVLTINSGLVSLANNLEFGFGLRCLFRDREPQRLVLNTRSFNTNASPANVINFDGGPPPYPPPATTCSRRQFHDLYRQRRHDHQPHGDSTTINNGLNGTGSGGLTVFATSPGTLTLAANNTIAGHADQRRHGGSYWRRQPGKWRGAVINAGQVDLGNASSQTVGAVTIMAAASAGNTIQNGYLAGTSYALSNSSGNAIITAVLQDSPSGSSGFTMSGVGTATLAAGNNFTGPTNINAGTVVIDASGGNNGSLGTTNVSVSGVNPYGRARQYEHQYGQPQRRRGATLDLLTIR